MQQFEYNIQWVTILEIVAFIIFTQEISVDHRIYYHNQRERMIWKIEMTYLPRSKMTSSKFSFHKHRTSSNVCENIGMQLNQMQSKREISIEKGWIDIAVSHRLIMCFWWLINAVRKSSEGVAWWIILKRMNNTQMKPYLKVSSSALETSSDECQIGNVSGSRYSLWYEQGMTVNVPKTIMIWSAHENNSMSRQYKACAVPEPWRVKRSWEVGCWVLDWNSFISHTPCLPLALSKVDNCRSTAVYAPTSLTSGSSVAESPLCHGHRHAIGAIIILFDVPCSLFRSYREGQKVGAHNWQSS